MGFDYFATSDDYYGPKYRECSCCGQDPICVECDGTGEVEMTPEEIEQDKDARRDEAADYSND